MADIVTPRVENQVELAKELKGDAHRARAEAKGVTLEDLDAMVAHGEAAIEADRQQKAQVVDLGQDRSERADVLASIFERADELRDRMPASVSSLEKKGEKRDASFLAALSYERFKIVGLEGSAPSDPADAEQVAELVRKRAPVEDQVSRLNALQLLITTLLERPVIIAELTRRQLGPEALTALRDDAKTEWKRGENKLVAAEATAREAENVRALKKLFKDNRRMFRKVVRGYPHLEALLAKC